VLVGGGAAAVAVQDRGGAGLVATTRPAIDSPSVVGRAESAADPAREGGSDAAGAAELALVAGVQELSDADLDVLLAEIEDLDAVPAAEPQPLILPLLIEEDAT
jgi:hypothetical protein